MPSRYGGSAHHRQGGEVEALGAGAVDIAMGPAVAAAGAGDLGDVAGGGLPLAVPAAFGGEQHGGGRAGGGAAGVGRAGAKAPDEAHARLHRSDRTGGQNGGSNCDNHEG